MHINRFVTQSLELHLFFCRIMKEHSLFLLAGFTPADPECQDKAGFFLREFEKLLAEAIALSDGVAGQAVLSSGEIVTEFTLLAEEQTECLTGIPIDQELTRNVCRLKPRPRPCGDFSPLQGKVRQLNNRALKLLEGLIEFKEHILRCVLQGEMFTMNYPLLIEHILREAKLYRSFLRTLQQQGELPVRSMRETECFWNQIMMEHAQFIRGLLDPCETALYGTADKFSRKYRALLATSRATQDQILTARSLEETLQFRDFKAAGTQGIQQCKIRSVILPLLADHVLREANHYIRLLESCK